MLVAVRFGLWTMMAELSFSVDDCILQYFVCFQQYSSRHRKEIRQRRCPSLFDSSDLVPLLLLPAPRQAGKACCALCVLFKNSFDLTAESSSRHFLHCNVWYQLKSLTIPEAIRHPTRETQEHRVTNTHFAAAPSAYGCSHAGNHTRTFLPVPHRSPSYA